MEKTFLVDHAKTYGRSLLGLRGRKGWMVDFAKDTGRKQLEVFAMGIIGAIVDERHSTAEQRIQEIKETLSSMEAIKWDRELPWDTTEKSPALTEDLEKMELLNNSTTTWNLEDIMRNEG